MSDTTTSSPVVRMVGMHSYDSKIYRGFNHHLLNEMIVAYLSVTETEHGIAARGFHELLYHHVNADRDTHGLTIDSILSGLVGKLYKQYKDRGYPGNSYDMLKAIESNIITAEPYDIYLGIHPTKAVDVYGWHTLFEKHAVKYKGHPHLFEWLSPQYAFNHTPSFSFNDLFPEAYDEYQTENGYPLTKWNSTNGCFFLEYSFDNRGTLDPIDVCTLKGKNYSYTFTIRFEELTTEPYNKAIFMVTERDETTGLVSIRGQMELDTTILIYEKMVFSYKKNKLFVKGLNSEMYIDSIFRDIPFGLVLEVPFGDRSTRGIHTFTYYNKYATKEELLYFLN